MSSGRRNGAGNGGGVQAIPSGSKTVVQSLKEIVNCPDLEIYAALKECNMDPNEAVNRLLSQDPFHEVKSKREKRKEGKDNSESRSRGANNSSNRGGKSGTDRHISRGASAAHYNASESSLHGKSPYKKENGSSSYTSSLSSTSAISGSTRSREHPGLSNGASAESKRSSLWAADGMLSVVQPASGYQPAWAGVPGQVSMADVVRMGKPHNKAPNASHQPEASSVQLVPTNEEWPSIEKPVATNVFSGPEYSVDLELHPEATGVFSDTINRHSEAEGQKIDDYIETSGGNDVGFVSISSRKIPEDDSIDSTVFEDELYKNIGSYQPEAQDFEHHEKAQDFEHHERNHDFEHHERNHSFEHHERNHDFKHSEDEEVDASVSSVTRHLEQISVTKDNRGFPSAGNAPSVVIPEHLQVQTADCSHLSFGSFGSGMSAAYSSGPATSVLVENNMEETHKEADISSTGHLNTRHSEYYVDDVPRNAPEGDLFHRNGASGDSYDAPSASQPEELKPESAEATHGNQYAFPSPAPGYTFDDSQHLLSAAFNQQISSQMQNLVPFSNALHSHMNSLPNSLLTANVHPTRESDLRYSPFPGTQSMSARYGNSVSSVGASAISMSEALKTAGLSSTQPGQQALSGTSVATGPPAPQQLALHPYSQPTLPMGQFANMIGYPYLPQSYAYMPSAFQQSLAGNSTYHQSLAAVLPQYKGSASVGSLPQSGAVASGYGAFGSSTTVPGNYQMNPPAGLSGTTLSYDDLLSSQYKENSHLVSLQQNENSAMWLHGPNSRTMPPVPASAFYNLQGQTQQPGGFRQGQQQQQQSQNYGSPGYPNFYHSQAGISLDQLQNSRDGLTGGSQGQPKPSQIWPNNY